jgi:TolA-binding protein
VRLYHQLQAEYPGSAEALSSHVMLGRMQLERRDTERALRHFEVYLQAAPLGSLAQEAMQGKAEALHRLGRFPEERVVWGDLLRAYPASIYAETARGRLREGG